MEVNEHRAPALVHLPHPLTTDGRHVHLAEFLKDETLGEYLKRQGVSLPRGAVSLWCNDIPVPSENWHMLMPYPGDRIVLRTAVEGGGGGGVGKVLRTVAMIAIVVAAVYTGQFYGATLATSLGTTAATASALVQAAVMIGGSLLVNALLPPPKATLASSAYQANSETPTYALNGGQNTARLYEPLPVCIGYNRVVPDVGANSYTEFFDQDQYLYQTFNFGLGDLTLSDFRIGDTPISNYSDVTIEVSGPDGKLSLVSANVDSMSVQDVSSNAGWVQRTTSPNTTRIWVDFVAVLFYANDKGGLDPRSVQFDLQYREVGQTAWQDFTGRGTLTIANSSQTPRRANYWLDVPAGQYEVRVRKLTPDVTDSREQNAFSWAQLRSYQLDTTDYTGQTRVGLRIKATSQLNGTISDFSALVQASCPVWTGAAWETKPTSNPAWWYLWWARGKFVNGRRVFGAGLPDSRIDIEGIKEFGLHCDWHGLSCNFVQAAATSIATMAEQIALCGDGSPTWMTGKLGVVWDAADQAPVMQFGPFNIKRDSFQIEYNTQNLADEIIINFVNPDKNWQTDQVRAKPPNVTAPSNPVSLNFIGCTNVALAGRKANLMAAAQYYRRRKITWVSDLEGFVAQRGDVVLLSHDMTAWSFAGRLVGGDRATLQLDRQVPLTAAPGFVGIRFPDGRYQVFGVQSGEGNADTLTLTSPIPAEFPVPSENPDRIPYDWAFVFDPMATPGKAVKITAVIPQAGGAEVQIIATDEEPAYYQRASGGYDYVPPRTYSQLNGDVRSITFNERLLDGVTGRSRVTIAWVTGAATTATVAVSINGGAPTTYNATNNSLEVEAYTNDILDVFVTPISLVQLRSAKGQGDRYIVQGLIAPLPAPTNLVTVYRDQLTHLTWSPVSDLRLPGYEVRIGPTWQSAVVVGTTPLEDIVAVGDGTYWVATRYVPPSGTPVYSAAVSIVIAGAALVRNVLVTRDEAPTWPGVLTGGAAVNAGSLVLAGAGNVLGDTDVLDESNILEYGGIATDGTYTLSVSHQVNVGRVVPCQLIIKTSVHGVRSTDNVLTEEDVLIDQDMLGEALGAAVTAKPQIAIAQGDGVFGDWQDFLPGVYNGQYFTARLLLSTTDPAIHPQVDQLSLTVDMPDRLDTGTNVAIGTGGLHVGFGDPFNAGPNGENVPHVQVTLLAAQAGDRVVITNISLSGFDVQVLNGTTAVARNINWSAQGY